VSCGALTLCVCQWHTLYSSFRPSWSNAIYAKYVVERASAFTSFRLIGFQYALGAGPSTSCFAFVPISRQSVRSSFNRGLDTWCKRARIRWFRWQGGSVSTPCPESRLLVCGYIGRAVYALASGVFASTMLAALWLPQAVVGGLQASRSRGNQ